MSILSTNTKLIKVGQDYSAGSGISIDDHTISVTGSFGNTYSAGDNISIYEQGVQLYISSKDWANDIANASANAYNEAVSQIPSPFDPSFISGQVDNKLDTTAFTAWQNGQYSTDLQTIEGQISNKQDSLIFGHGTASGSVSSINGSAIIDDWTYHMLKVTRVDTANLHRTLNSNSGTWNTVTNKLDTSSFSDVSGSFLTAHQSLDGYATVEDVESATIGKADTSGVVDYFNKPVEIGGYESVWASGGKLHAGYTAEAAYLYASGNSENFTMVSPTQIWTKSGNKNTIDITKLSATTNGFTAAGIEIGQSKVEISGGSYYGVQIRTPNEAIASAGLYFSDENVSRSAPLFSAKNVYGDGFAIWAGGAKGFDANGNTIWDVTKATAPEQLIAGSEAPKPSILISQYMPKSQSAYFNQAPLLSADGNGIYIGLTGQHVESQMGGLTSRNGNVRAEQANGAGYVTGYSYLTGYDVGVYHSSAFGSANSGTWSLTGSVQKREIEYDAETSAITAIAGSAIGGGGGGVLSGNYIPYTAVDPVFNAFQTNSGLQITTARSGNLRSTDINDDYISLTYIDSNIGIYLNSTLTTGSLTFKTSSDSAYLDKEKIHTWDSASNYIQNNSSTWNDVSTTVQSNSAQWSEVVTGEFVPQSAFDELKQSYDALSSLFATYSGQWLLPNEGV